MFNINQLLEKVRALRNSDVGIRTTVQVAIKKLTGADIPISSLSIKSGKVSIKNLSSAAKAEIFLKKPKILEEIRLVTGNDRVRDIN